MSAPRIAALGLAALAGIACQARSVNQSSVPEDEVWVDPLQIERGEVQVAEVHEEFIPQVVAAAGRVTFDDLLVQHVLSPFAGQVARVLAPLGRKVEKGTPLATLLSPDVGTVFSDLVKARADLAQTSAELARQERLSEAQAGPRRDLEAAQDAHRKAEAEVARAREKAALLRSGDVDAVSQEYTLRSAVKGEVLVRSISPGMQVQGAYSGGAPVELFTIGDIDRVWVLADLGEADVARVRRGADATVRVAALPGRVFRGKVDWIAGTLDPALRTARVRVALANADHALKPEMLAQVSITASRFQALVVPRKGIVPIEGESFAFVGEGQAPDGRSRFKRRRLRVSGDPGDELAVVQEGAVRGDRVVVEPGSQRRGADEPITLSRAQFDKAGLRLEPVREGLAAATLTTGARLAFDDARVAHVFSPVTGRVTRVLASPGQHVPRGTPLLAIVSPDVGSAFADAVKADADLVAARHELARQRELVEAHAGARKDLEVAEATWRKAQAEVERARQKTRLLAAGTFDAVTQEYTLRSPIEGEVVARTASPGLEVQGQWSGAGSPVELFTVGQLDPLWVLGDVYEMDLARIHEGLSVVARVPAFPGRTFTGRIDWVSNVLDPATRTARVRCVIENPGDLLRPEMAPVLSITLPGHRHLAVPREAMLRLGDDQVVFVAAPGAAEGQLAFRQRKVVVGEDRAGGLVPVLDGLAAGEQVVTAGAIFLVGLL